MSRTGRGEAREECFGMLVKVEEEGHEEKEQLRKEVEREEMEREWRTKSKESKDQKKKGWKPINTFGYISVNSY